VEIARQFTRGRTMIGAYSGIGRKGGQMDLEERLLFRVGFLHAQVSGIFGALKHTLRGTEDLDRARANMAYIESQVGDLIVQTHLLCDQLEIDYRKCEQLGWKRYNELKASWDASGYGDKWA
jgi:hypothetical protein